MTANAERGGDPERVVSIAELAVARARKRIAEQGMPPHVVSEQERQAALATELDRLRAAPRPPDVPSRYRTPLDELEQTAAVTTATRWLDAYQAGRRDRGLLLIGPVGAGKSAIAGALAVACGAPTYATFWPVPDLLTALQDGFRTDGPTTVLHRIAQRDLLVLDDLGAERPTDWTTGVLAGLVSARYDAERCLIVTANLTAPQLGDHLGERALSRLHEMTDLVVVDGPDRRRTGGGA